MKPLLALALACSPVIAMAQTAPTPSTTAAAADTPGTTDAGVHYVQPKDWAADRQGRAIILAAPEKDLRIVLVDIGPAADAAAAATAAWAAYRQGAAPAVELSSAAPAGDGWDERVSIAYRTLPSERAIRAALALRKGTGWTVMLVDGAAGTANKRSAAISVVQQGLRPTGFRIESFAGKTANRLTPERVEQLRRFVEQSAAALEVPGVGLALIQDGKVIWEGGVGVRALGAPEKVDAHTKFMIASNTKGLTTLLLSVLADEGKLRWDQPVINLYPSFRLGSDEVTRSVQVKHLVCACTGLPRQDYGFILADAGQPAAETFRGLAATHPTSKFGELFQYNNLMASAAGYIGGALVHPDMEIGAAYDRAMQEKVFGPLGMRDSSFDYAKGMAGNWAAPHGLDIDGRMVRMSNDFNFAAHPHRPAGAAFASTADMVRYVQLELSGGVLPNGKRMVSQANLFERRRKGVQVGPDSWYGMGLFQRDAWGIPVVTHGGTLVGYHTTWFALPEAGVGAVILTNADPGAQMLAPFFRRLVEVLYDGQPQAEQEVAAAAQRIRAETKAKRDGLTFPGDPAVLAGLAPHYLAPGVGQITISERNGAKWMKAGFVEGPIATRANADGTTSIVSAGPGIITIEALVGKQGDKRTLSINDGQQNDYVYVEDGR